MSESPTDPLGTIEGWRSGIAEVRARLVQALREEVEGRGSTRVVLGLSGGLDSAVAAALCAQALGAENVLAVLMPVRTTDPNSLSLAQGAVNALGVTSRRVNMSPLLDAYFANFPDATRARRGFCLAWLRAGALLDLAGNYGAAAVQVLNRTDRLLGYGEGQQELAPTVKPLAGLFKTQVRLLGEQQGLLPEILRRRPSLEHWPGQTDEGDLGVPYATLDPVLEALAERGLEAAAAVAQGLDPAAVRWAAERLAQPRPAAAAAVASARS